MSHIAELMRGEEFRKISRLERGTAFLKRHALASTVATVLLSGGAVALYHAASAGAAPPPAPAAIPVTTAMIAPQNVRIWSEFSGRMVAVNAAELRPEVSGRISEIRFRDGQQVKAGDILFVIDPRPYAAAQAKAQADVATAVTNARLAKTELDRATKLLALEAVAKSYYDQRANTSSVSQAAIQSAEAELTQARLDIDHAYVKAPISGRVSRAEITVGNLVQAGPNTPLLTSIVSDDGIYADFEVDEQTYLQSIRAHANTATEEQQVPVELTVRDGGDRVYKGTIYSFDNKIDTGTGTIRARARFANADASLIPGMFVSVRLANSSNSKVLLVPEQAVGNDQSKRFVYVVDHGKAAFREIALGQDVDGKRVVLSGLKPGERVIVDGLQRVQPGAAVETAEKPARRQFAAR
ncbi:MAG TPA: efflux RND transporter periplasmic adaptor subunit [Rhizomicrobium sp.]|jgi:multidrug efflux system membrane fusion protein